MRSQLTREGFNEALRIYEKAWTSQNPQLILTIFSEDAEYHERVLGQPIRGHDGIRAYWEQKVARRQGNIEFALLHAYVDGQTGIAEWEVWFDDKEQMVRKHMREVAILEFRNGLVGSLREYWSCEEVPAEQEGSR